MAKRYIILTAISTHKIRYAIPEEALSADTDEGLIDKANDAVIAEKVDELSQEWLGETVIDERFCTEEEMLNIFDKENVCYKGWAKEKKINYLSVSG